VFEGEGAPLLWFDDFSKHPAYDGIVEVLKGGAKDGPACESKSPKGKGKDKGSMRHGRRV
jgi:endo-1,4-beta-xylanase